MIRAARAQKGCEAKPVSGAVDFARLEAALGASREPTAKHICIGDSVQKARAACCARGRALLLIFAAAPRHPLATCRRHAGLLRRRRTRSKRRRPSFAATGCLILTFRRISRCAAPAWYCVPPARRARGRLFGHSGRLAIHRVWKPSLRIQRPRKDCYLSTNGTRPSTRMPFRPLSWTTSRASCRCGATSSTFCRRVCCPSCLCALWVARRRLPRAQDDRCY